MNEKDEPPEADVEEKQEGESIQESVDVGPALEEFTRMYGDQALQLASCRARIRQLEANVAGLKEQLVAKAQKPAR